MKSGPRQDERRARYLRALRELILAAGFADLTTEDIAAALRCSKATIYSLWRSKDDLVAAALRDFLREVDTRAALSASRVDDPAERVSAYLTTVGAQLRQISTNCYRDLVSNGATSEVYAAEAHARASRLAGYLRCGVASGGFRPTHVDFVTAAVGLLSREPYGGYFGHRAEPAPVEWYRQLSDLVVASLTNRDWV